LEGEAYIEVNPYYQRKINLVVTDMKDDSTVKRIYYQSDIKKSSWGHGLEAFGWFMLIKKGFEIKRIGLNIIK